MKEIVFNTMVDKTNETPEDINIVVTGDYCLDRRIEGLCLSEDYSKIYGNMLYDLKENDIAITNLECPLTENESSIEKIGPNLKANPVCIEAIKYGLSLALH